YLTDFGLTKRTADLSGGLTATGHFLGTVDYVSPEQIQGKPLGPGTDIYALGCVLYECLTGQLPFRRDDDAALLWAHLVEAPQPVTGIRPELPPAVNAVVARAMAKDPADRYQSCEELLHDLEPALGLPAPVSPSQSRETADGRDGTGPDGSARGTDAASTVADDRPALSIPTAAWRPPPDEATRASASVGPPAPAGPVAAPVVGPDDTAARADPPTGAEVVAPAAAGTSGRVPEPRSGERPGGVPSEAPPSQPPSAPPPTEPSKRARGPRRRPALLVLGLVLLVVGVGLIGFLALRPDSGPRADPAPTTPAASAPAPPTEVAPAVPIPSIGSTIPVGDTPGFVAAAPNGRQLYVANREAGVVTVVDTAVDQVTATIPISAGPPQFIAFSPDGRKAYVSVWDDARTIATVIVLDTTTNAVAATIPVETRPYLSAVSPDGGWVYVPNHDTGTVSVIDASTDELITSFAVPANPHWVAFTPDGSTAYTANHESNLVAAIDPSNNTVVAEIPVPASPHSIAVHPTRPLAIVASYDADSASVIDTGTNKVIATIPVGLEPQHAAWSADGRFAYITNNGDDTVSVIDADALAVTATIPTGSSPTSVAVLPDGSRGYVSELREGTLTVLNLAG
ncbi:serine/threonine-protein kinase, partial [Geodermatophilus sp. YIM 151500]|uniref:serine/threonine-protein kinase n=1 Tax=Geodermatophilus sp. YIM 151500 TaxID=2984531 RepID=UPI0021E36165